MSVEIPDEVKWLLPIVVGESWPEGDEDKLRELRDAWTAVAEALPDAMETGNRAAREALATWNGEAATKFDETWRKFSGGGGDAVFHSLEEGSKGLAEACDKAALDIEYTKYMIIASLVVLAIQIAAMVAAAFVSFGASSAGIVPAQLATRAAVQAMFRQLVEKLLQQGVKKVVREALEKVLKKGLEKVASKAALKSLGTQIGVNAGLQVGMDAGIQGVQMAKGDRDSWDWGKTKDAAAGGVAGGVAGHLVSGNAAGRAASDAVSGGGSSVLGHAARGAAEGALGTVGQAAATGNLGDLKASDLAMGASSGAVDGGSGGAKDGFHDASRASEAAESANSAAHSASSAADGASAAHDAGATASSVSTEATHSAPAAESAPAAGSSSSGSTESTGSSGVSSGSSSVATSGDSGPAHPASTSSAGAVAPERPETSSAAPSPAGLGGHAVPGSAAQAGGPNVHGGSQFGGQAGNLGMAGGPVGGSPHAGAPRADFPSRAGGFGAAPDARAAQSGGGQPYPPNQSAAPQRGFAPQGGQLPQNTPSTQNAPSAQNTPGPQQGGPPRYAPQGQYAPPGPVHQGGPQHGQAPQSTAPANISPTGHQGQAGPNAPQRSPQQGFPQQQPNQRGAAPQDPRAGWQQGGQPPRGPVAPNGGTPPRQAPMQGRPQSPEALRQPPQQRPVQGMGPDQRRPMPPQARTPAPPTRETGPQHPATHDATRPRTSLPQENPQRHSAEQPAPRHEPTAHPESRPREDGSGRIGENHESGTRSHEPTSEHARHPDAEHDAPESDQHHESGPEHRDQPEHHADPDHEGSDATDSGAAPHHDSGPATPFHESEIHETWKPAMARAAEHEGAEFSKDQSLDFARDPEYRAPDAAFEAMDRHLRANGDYTVPTRRAELTADLNERFQASPELRSMSKEGALAVRAYTGHEVFGEVNRAARFGMMTEHQRHLMQAIVSGMNEGPIYQGPMERGLNFGQHKQAADFAVAHYEVGKVTVETQILSGTMVDEAKAHTDFPADVRMIIDTKAARQIDGLAENPGEGEAGLKPMSQLYVHDKKLVTWDEVTEGHDQPVTKFAYEVRAEEIVPGDPRYLDPEEANRQVAERQRRAFGEQLVVDAGPSEIARKLEGDQPQHTGHGGAERAEQHRSIEDQLDPNGHTRAAREAEAAIEAAEPRKPYAEVLHPEGEPNTGADHAPSTESRITERLEGSDQPGELQPGHEGLPQPGNHGEVPPLPVNADGTPNWQALSGPTPPVTTLPALHGGSAPLAHGDAYLANNHPELRKVNPNYYTAGSWDAGWQTNCSKCVVNYARRLMGIEEAVEPVKPDDLPKVDRMGWMAHQLGSSWEGVPPNYDHVIQRMGQQPIGSHASVYVAFDLPPAHDGAEGGSAAHVAIVTNTPHGVAFIDPQTGHLMNLPHPPKQLALLPFGANDPGATHSGSAHVGAEQHEGTAPAERTSPNIELPQDSTAADRGRTDTPETNGDQRVSDAEEPEGRGWRQDGPWLGQHVNPAHPGPLEDEQYDLGQLPDARIVPTVEPAGPTAPHADPPPAPGGPGPGTAGGGAGGSPAAGAPAGPAAPAGAAMSPPAMSGLNHSMSGDLGLGDPAAPHSRSGELPQPSAADNALSPGAAPGGAPAGTTAMGGSSSAAAGAAEMGGAGAPEHAPHSQGAMRPGATSGAGAVDQQGAQSQAAPSGAAQAGPPMAGAPMGAAPPPQGGGENSRREGRAPDLGAVTHNRDIAIPPDVAALYLGNHEPTTLLPADGRQVLFRPDAAIDVGARSLGDTSAGVPHLRYEAPDRSSMGVPFDDREVPEEEFAGRAEIYVHGDDGSEVVLGSFEAGQWTPSPEGSRWLGGAQRFGDEWGRTR